MPGASTRTNDVPGLTDRQFTRQDRVLEPFRQALSRAAGVVSDGANSPYGAIRVSGTSRLAVPGQVPVPGHVHPQAPVVVACSWHDGTVAADKVLAWVSASLCIRTLDTPPDSMVTLSMRVSLVRDGVALDGEGGVFQAGFTDPTGMAYAFMEQSRRLAKVRRLARSPKSLPVSKGWQHEAPASSGAAPVLVRIPSSSAGRDVVALSPSGMTSEQAVSVANALVLEVRHEARHEGGECDDGLGVHDSLVARLQREGFVMASMAESHPWDADVEDAPEPPRF